MSRPNILWLSLESVRADHTSLYSYKRQTTPFLESLSQRSDAVAIDPLISASMWTPASTASILTGTHMSTHQVGQDGKAEHPLPASIQTLPELLSNQGYHTALFSTNAYIGPNTGLDQGFDDFEYIKMSKENFTQGDSVTWDSIKTAFRCLASRPVVTPSTFKRELGSATNDLLEFRMSRWFDQTTGSNKPFFAYAHIPSPHHPYQPINRFLEEFVSDIDISASAALNQVDEIYDGSAAIKRQMAHGIDFTDDVWENIKNIV